MFFRSGPTLTEAKETLLGSLQAGTICPCCEQFAKLYKRQIHSSMAAALIAFYKLCHGNTDPYFHTLELLKTLPAALHQRACGDFAKLSIWGLIEEKQKEEDGPGRTSGRWRLTEKGGDFVRGAARVPQYVYLYNDSIKGWSENNVSISDCLKNKFDYEQLMKGV